MPATQPDLDRRQWDVAVEPRTLFPVRFLYGTTIFLSAFLLFQVQPIIGKMILPWFGGGSSVWNACMVFFQVTLLLGYLYAHWLHENLEPRRQALVHVALLAVSLFLLPIAANPSWKGSSLTHPELSVVGLLTVTVGLPYMMLSTTGPLVQAWFARTVRSGTPYRLYALSNLASMSALLSYPVLVEPWLPLRVQTKIWSLGYAAFAVSCGVAAWRAAGGAPAADRARDEAQGARPDWKTCLLWVALAACPSVLLLTITRHLTQDVAPIPLLWVLPLSIYLLSFILCFDAPRYYYRPAFLAALVAALLAAGKMLSGSSDVLTGVATLSGCLFVFCMVCHGELVRRKPHSRHLTLFYLMLSTGGALGGAFVGLLAPALFTGFFEFPLGLTLAAALGAVVVWRESRTWMKAAAVVAVCAYAGWMTYEAWDTVTGYRRVMRNFYSQLRVEEWDDDTVGSKRALFHGRISHGTQALKAPWRTQPAAYYCADSGVGRAIRALDGGARKIGVVGLGTGTLAVYGRAGDQIRIYEINPQVEQIARSEFFYLPESKARVDVVLGDGRLMLEKEAPQNFDVLAIDAFSGDSIPTHLLTVEAIQRYLMHLKPDGILALHVTNTYLDLQPVVAGAAASLGRAALLYEYHPPEEDALCHSTEWALVMSREKAAALPALLAGGQRMVVRPGFRRWTDDYTNMLGILK